MSKVGAIASLGRTAPPRARQAGRFLAGPIPWAWLARAMALPGKALHVGLVVWLRTRMRRSTTAPVNLSRIDGVTRHAAARGLLELERAGLVLVHRRPKRSALVTLSGVAQTGLTSRA